MFKRSKLETVFISLTLLIFSCEDNNSESVETVSSIVVSPVNPLTEPNKATQFFALVISSSNKELLDQPIVWKSSNEDVAIVDEKGMVTSKNQGYSDITAELGDVKGSSQIVVSSIRKRVLSEMFTSST